MESSREKIMGPQRSQSRTTLPRSPEPPSRTGRSTVRKLLPMRLTSRMIVAETGSSSVEGCAVCTTGSAKS